MDELFVNSREIDREEVLKTGSFTTLQVRINHRDDLANAATHQLLDDWNTQVGDGCGKASHSSLCDLGNWCSLVFPETQYERLAILTYLTDLGLIHDDTSEDMQYNEAVLLHDDLGAALDINDDRRLAKGSKSDKLKKLVAKFLLDALSMDREKGILMVDSYRQKWLAIMEHQNTEEFCELNKYLAFRRENGGMDPFWSMARFGMDLTLTPEELQSVDHIFQSTDNALVLTNDYYSWEREYANSQKVGAGRIVNSVELIMRTQGISADAAKQFIKDKIIFYEEQFVQRKTEFYDQFPKISVSLRRWVETAGTIIAGNHYWCTRCPRHHSFASETNDADISTSGSEKSETFSEGPQRDSRSDSTVDSCHDESEKKDDLAQSKAGLSTATEADLARPKAGPDTTADEIKPEGEHSWVKPDSTALLAPCTYIGSMPSKGVRSSLIDALNTWFGVSKASISVIEEIVRLLHDASLILDDIEDNSALRRGKPAVHTIFGHSQAINSANYMFVQAVAASRHLQNQEGTDILLEDLQCLYLGQSLDLHWKYTLACPTENEYLTMIDNKTGGMFRLLLRLMRAESPRHSEISFNRLILLFGRFFQIRDDYMNLASGQYTDQKGFCEDLDEGKFSYPIVHCLERNPEFKTHLLGIFRQRPSSLGGHTEPLAHESKIFILDHLEKSGALEATLRVATRLEDELTEEITRLESVTGETNPMLRILLIRLSNKGKTHHPIKV